MDTTAHARKKLFGFSLIMAPALLALSTVFWENGEVSLRSGPILIYALMFWGVALLGLLELLREKTPRLATWGMLMVVMACIGGVNWANEGMYADLYRVAAGVNLAPDQRILAMGASGPLTLHIPGLLFPLTLISIGIALLRTKTAPAWCAVALIVGGIGFPVSRIPRIDMLAHVADLILLVAGIGLGMQMLRAGNRQVVEQGAMKPRTGVA